MRRHLLCLIVLVILIAGCAEESQRPESVDRESKIPADAVKVTPETDVYPPQLHSDEYEEPVPLPYPVNTAGAEDSAFIMPDGQTLYVWFTPDSQVPVEKQVIDNVTGIYVSEKQGGIWGSPERVILQDEGKLALDGCEFVQGNVMWFCTAREGYTGVHLFTAEFENGRWSSWKEVDEKLVEYEVGEMHLTSDGKELYYHSARAGGKGGYDIWVSQKVDGEWQEPENVDAVNSEETDGWPFITENGAELWFTRTYLGSPGIFKSEKVNGEWQEPELILSQFAGECSLDNEGNIYFTHHFYEEGKMIEADIYVARRR